MVKPEGQEPEQFNPQPQQTLVTPSEIILQTRQQFSTYIHVLATLLVLPFALLQFSQGNMLLTLAILVFALYNSVVAYVLFKHQHYLFNGWGLVLLSSGLVLYSCTLNGLIGLLWAYPAIATYFLLLPLRQATIGALIFFSAVTTIAMLTQDPTIAIRLVATQLLCIGFAVMFSWLLTAQQRKLVSIATTDPLTGCSNRLELNAALEESTYSRHRYQIPSSLIILDLDHFKQVNDSIGHTEGDRLLKALAKLLTSRLRVSDKLFRYGGEEFIALLPNTRLIDAHTLAEALRTGVEDGKFQLSASKLKPPQRITISAGVAEINAGEGWENWLMRADEALYQAKHQGRNIVVVSPNLSPKPVSLG
ncbi:signal transduction diguanylate cyclase [Oleiphilus messinensis]|uniref:diguanylate cyclase n=1 Tax=Oleiphilus messinensis TaxID=141451 RepID=A0A1Y0I2U3_9GAMM|nr:GGDEF domain-containing protein [Oleiphilus messinensis]ARU54529.1 signal transduction diguanylate cyclase [Oleiphilus messinensis]